MEERRGSVFVRLGTAVNQGDPSSRVISADSIRAALGGDIDLRFVAPQSVTPVSYYSNCRRNVAFSLDGPLGKYANTVVDHQFADFKSFVTLMPESRCFASQTQVSIFFEDAKQSSDELRGSLANEDDGMVSFPRDTRLAAYVGIENITPKSETHAKAPKQVVQEALARCLREGGGRALRTMDLSDGVPFSVVEIGSPKEHLEKDAGIDLLFSVKVATSNINTVDAPERVEDASPSPQSEEEEEDPKSTSESDVVHDL